MTGAAISESRHTGVLRYAAPESVEEARSFNRRFCWYWRFEVGLIQIIHREIRTPKEVGLFTTWN